MSYRCVTVLMIVLFVLIGNAGASVMEPERVAIVVGANAAPYGRTPLRYGHNDARNIGHVLVDAAQFPADAVHVLLDPKPKEIVELLDQEIQRLHARQKDSLLFFYYSGHSDETSLYPNGEPLLLEELKKRLDNKDATVRIGVIDACSGGSWTNTKGLNQAPAFKVDLPLRLTSSGTALLASSSGAENAHESEMLQGSFFTHHLIAALRGAADHSGDGEITLTEAFTYAKEYTIRDTSLYAMVPQHPSFQLKLHGRGDLPLARLASTSTGIELSQQKGPLQIIALNTGLIVLEVPEGERLLKLALPPGHYLVRRRSGDETYSRRVNLADSEVIRIDEEHLELAASADLTAKGVPQKSPTVRTTVPDGTWDVRVGAAFHWRDMDNYNTNSWYGTVVWGLTDRLQWLVPLPAFSYRFFGDGQPFEAVIWGGLTGIGYVILGLGTFEPSNGGFEEFAYQFGIGADGVWHFASNQNVGVGFFSDAVGYYRGPPFLLESGTSFSPFFPGLRGTVSYSLTVQGRGTLNLGVSYGPDRDRFNNSTLRIGSGHTRAFRRLPLIQIHINDMWSIDAYAAVDVDLGSDGKDETYTFMGGATWTY